MPDHTTHFTRENLDEFLKELGKEYRRLNGKAMKAEIVLIGGAAILANYGFRDMTTDVDAAIHAASSMKDAINRVGDRFQLPNGWLNEDFMQTESYSPRIWEHSIYYRQFSNVLEVRTVSAEYLIAMKLRSGRKYKNDLSDVIGILYEHSQRSQPLTMEQIDKAVCDLYGGWDGFSEDVVSFIRGAMKERSYLQAYEAIRREEQQAGELIQQFQKGYPQTVNSENVNSILESLKRKRQQGHEER